jgi:hypothetical protein
LEQRRARLPLASGSRTDPSSAPFKDHHAGPLHVVPRVRLSWGLAIIDSASEPYGLHDRRTPHEAPRSRATRPPGAVGPNGSSIFPSEVSPFTDGSLSPGPYPPAVDYRGDKTRDGVRTSPWRLDFRALFPVKIRWSSSLPDPLLGFGCPPGPSTRAAHTVSSQKRRPSLRFAAGVREGTRQDVLRFVLRRGPLSSREVAFPPELLDLVLASRCPWAPRLELSVSQSTFSCS